MDWADTTCMPQTEDLLSYDQSSLKADTQQSTPSKYQACHIQQHLISLELSDISCTADPHNVASRETDAPRLEHLHVGTRTVVGNLTNAGKRQARQHANSKA